MGKYALILVALLIYATSAYVVWCSFNYFSKEQIDLLRTYKDEKAFTYKMKIIAITHYLMLVVWSLATAITLIWRI